MITKNKENKNGFQIYQDLLVYIVENLDKLVDDFYQDLFTPLLKQMKKLDTLLTFKDNILETKKKNVRNEYFIEVLVDKTETEYITHSGSPNAKILNLLQNTIPDFDKDDFDDTLSFDVKDKKFVLYNFMEYASPYKNGLSLTTYPFTLLKNSFTENLKQRVQGGEDCPYTSLTVLVVKHYAGIISAEEVKQELKKKITDVLKWATVIQSTGNSSVEVSDSLNCLPMILSVHNMKRINTLEIFYTKFVVGSTTDLYMERLYFTQLNSLFHFTKEEVELVFNKKVLKEKAFFLNCLE